MPKPTQPNHWSLLRKAWRRYKVAKNMNDREDMMKAAQRIRELQRAIGLMEAKFPDLGLN